MTMTFTFVMCAASALPVAVARWADVLLEGVVDLPKGGMCSAWQAGGMAMGDATSGTWTARKVAPGEGPPSLLQGWTGSRAVRRCSTEPKGSRS